MKAFIRYCMVFNLLISYNKIITQNMKSNMSLIDSNAIRNHPSNNSPSKNAFQFSKSKRFPDYNP